MPPAIFRRTEPFFAMIFTRQTTYHRAAWCLLLFASVSWAETAWHAPSPGEVEYQLQNAPYQPLATRLEAVTRPFLGAPYTQSSLGEGSYGDGIDTDPRIRFDTFDCTTFVETAIALAMSRDLDETQAVLDLIRYRGGKPEYINRRHFPEAEWLPELIALGFLKEITRDIGGPDVVVEKKRLDLSVWKQRNHPYILSLPDARIPTGTFSIPTWTLDAAAEGHERIPPGTLLNLVRIDFHNVPVRISHQGIVVKKADRLYLRHAADRMFHSVVDEPLSHFFLRMKKYQKWPVSGVNLTLITRPMGW